jgi:hypothetical protein
MRTRPVRPNIYLPVVRFGVADSDWFSVLLISCAGYLLPVAFGITILYVPLQMWTWLIATAGSIAFFNYIRIGKPARWLPHRFAALVLHHRQNRALPNGRKQRFHRDWIIRNDFDDPPNNIETPPRTTASTFLLEYNNRFQEESAHTCNALLLTTN